MSDDRKDELPLFVPNDDSAAMIANFAARRRQAYAAALAYSGSGADTPFGLTPTICRGEHALIKRNRKFLDSPLEGAGFEPSVPHYATER
jgi:hypothetical protein